MLEKINKYRYIKLILFSLINFFFINQLNAQYVYVDKSNFTFEQIIKKKNIFEETKKLTYGINNNVYWLKVDLKNTSENIVNKYILFDFAFLKSITAYNEENEKIIKKQNGYSIPMEQKEIEINDIAFKYTLKANEEKTVYLRISNDLANILAYKIFDESEFLKIIKIRTIIEMAILSGLIILFFYYLFIALSLKSQIYYLYLGYLIAVIFFFANLTNLLNYIDFFIFSREKIQVVSVGLISLFSLLFLNKFRLEKYPFIVNFLFKLGVVLSLFLIFLGLLDVDTVLNLPQIIKKILIVSFIFSIFTIVLYYLIKKYKESLYLIIAWCLFLIGSILQVLLVVGVLNNSIFRYSMGIGALCVAILYSLILARNYKFAQEKTIEWKDKYLHELEIQNKEKDKLLDKHIIYSSTDLKGIITEVSQAFCEVSGYTKEELIGKSHNIIRHPDMDCEVFEELWKTIKDDKTWIGEVKNRKKDGDFYWVLATVSPIFKNDIKVGYSAVRQNISNKKKMEEASITDELTQIYNRRYFNEVFVKFIDIAKRNDELVNFVILDVDHFKQYNDKYGHVMGDKVLKKIAYTMKNSLKRGNDYCFRLGGEEFGILFYSNSEVSSIVFANKIKENIEKLKIEHEKNSASEYVTASFGLYIKHANLIENIDDVYKEADILLYEAKEKGRNRVVHN